MKTQLASRIDGVASDMRRLALEIGSRPETGNEEYFASGALADALEHSGFAVERGIVGLPTAFIARYETGKPGPTVALLAEYDALPGIGHACGHHLIGTMSAAAAIALQPAFDRFGGTIRVYGTPAEETNGAKVRMAEAGLFRDCSFALMAHPYYRFERSGTSMAMDALRFEFRGKAAHAAANPHDGINALDAVLLLFNGLNALRQQCEPHARIHGIIPHGGTAPNVIPDYASAEFYVRAATRSYTNALTARVARCAEGAAMQTGCALDISNYELSYDELRTNETLSETFTNNLIDMGVAAGLIAPGSEHGSLDLGNVSLQCPVAHPFVQVIDEPFALHTLGFRDAVMTERALDGMLFGAKAIVFTVYDCIRSPERMRRIRREFERTSAAGTGGAG